MHSIKFSEGAYHFFRQCTIDINHLHLYCMETCTVLVINIDRS